MQRQGDRQIDYVAVDFKKPIQRFEIELLSYAQHFKK